MSSPEVPRYLEGLNPEQRDAVLHEGSPLLILAGAGSGKTRVITCKIAYLIAERGRDPSSILAVTFTNKAAREMGERVAQMAPGASRVLVKTFHSFGAWLLRRYGSSIGLAPAFAIYDDDDSTSLLSSITTGVSKRELSRYAHLISKAKDYCLSPEDDLRSISADPRLPELYAIYEKRLHEIGNTDFGDLIGRSVELLKGNVEVRERIQGRFSTVLVDEYQDSNVAQYELLKSLVGPATYLCVVGDDDQSIYRFRGASRASLERFLKSFPGARTITLGRNRRSSRRIVAAASALIDRNPDRLPKQLRSEQAGPQVEVWACPDGTAEAHAIASEAAALIERGTSPAAIAVLCRTNAIARPIATALSALGLPHAVTGGHGFQDRPEVRDLVALLRVLRDPADLVALARVMSQPPANLDQAAVLDVLRARGPRSPLETLRAWPPAATLAGQLERFAAETHRFDVRDLFFELMETTGYLEVLNASLDAGEAARATANVSRFAEAIAEFCEESPDHSLENYMRHLDLVLLSGEDEEPAAPDGPQEAIQVMTIHQAKGLEFDVVFVPSLVEGRLPQSGRSPRFELPPAVLEPLVRGREDVIAEERRLLYVAMTRAKTSLHLTWGAHYEGGRRWRESRFLQEVRAAGARTVREREVDGCPAAPPATAAIAHAGEVHLSYSGIAAYLDCPRQYWYRYEQRLPAVQNAEAVHGVILHEVLRRAGELRREGGAVGASHLRAILAEVWRTTAFSDERRAPTFKRNGAAQLEAYRKKGGLDAVPAYLEHPFQVEVDGWTLRGVIDRIDRTASGWTIVDYKSGRPVSRRKRDLQLALYALGATSALALDPVELELVYLASGESVRIEKPGALLSEARAEGTRAAGGIREGRFEARPDRRRCRLCPYRLACADAL